MTQQSLELEVKLEPNKDEPPAVVLDFAAEAGVPSDMLKEWWGR
jgi:hypothetical protein